MHTLEDGTPDLGAENKGRKNRSGGYAGLDEDGKLAGSQMPAVIANQAHSTASDAAGAVADLNALIDKLVAAGLMVAPTTTTTSTTTTTTSTTTSTTTTTTGA